MSKLKSSVFAATALFSTLCLPMEGDAQEIDNRAFFNRAPDVSKLRLESPTKNFLRSNSDVLSPTRSIAPVAGRMDIGKSSIEQPVKRVISGNSFMTSGQRLRARPVAKTTDIPARSSIDGGGKVSPGMVSWHSTFNNALKASAASKRPVLVFHLMGNLDDRFC